jgi:hypothetical protein
MRYLCLLYAEENSEPNQGMPFFSEETVAANVAAREAMAKAGVLIDCGPLYPASSATTVTIRDGEALLTDGPYAELKEQFGGYYLLECEDLDTALRWAQTMPAARTGSVEVRPVIDTRGGN